MNDSLTGSRGSKTDLASINKPSDLKNRDRLAGSLQKPRPKADPAGTIKLSDLKTARPPGRGNLSARSRQPAHTTKHSHQPSIHTMAGESVCFVYQNFVLPDMTERSWAAFLTSSISFSSLVLSGPYSILSPSNISF